MVKAVGMLRYQSRRVTGRIEPRDRGRGMPVVRVDDVGPPIDRADEFQRGAAEERKAIDIVAVAVDLRPTKEVAFGDEVDGHIAAGELAFEHARRNSAHARGDEHATGQRRTEFQLTGVIRIFDGAIGGHDDAHIVAHRAQSLGQRSGHVAEAAGFGKRCNFRTEAEDFEHGNDLGRRSVDKRAEYLLALLYTDWVEVASILPTPSHVREAVGRLAARRRVNYIGDFLSREKILLAIDYLTIALPHSFTHFASMRCSRFFFKFSRMIHATSASGLTSHFSIAGLPSIGEATTATLQQ